MLPIIHDKQKKKNGMERQQLNFHKIQTIIFLPTEYWVSWIGLAQLWGLEKSFDLVRDGYSFCPERNIARIIIL